MDLEAALSKKFFAALEAAGMPEVPGEFSVVPQHQVIPGTTLQEIARFIRVFDRVTAREAWQAVARRAGHCAVATAGGLLFQRLGFSLSPRRGLPAYRVQRQRVRVPVRRDHQCPVLWGSKARGGEIGRGTG